MQNTTPPSQPFHSQPTDRPSTLSMRVDRFRTVAFSHSSAQPLIIQLLVGGGVLDSRKLEILREARTKDTNTVERILVKKALATERDIAEAYSTHLNLPFYSPISDVAIDPALSRFIPEKLCRDQWLAPIASSQDTLEVVFVRPDEFLVIDELQLLTGLVVRPLITTETIVQGILDVLYGSCQAGESFTSTEEFEEADEEDEAVHRAENEAEILHLDQPPPPGRDGRIIRMVNQILEQAIRFAASDIHLERFEDNCKIRLRIDGFLHEMTPPPLPLFVPILSRFKILAKMDIAEKRIPQDGAIALRAGEKRIDLRVSTVPTVYGEKMVLRLLDKSAIPLDITGLGLDDLQAKDLTESIKLPHGLMLVTGPTGSGKSTTLYACLNLLNEPNTNICTVEDPVEYKFRGLNQIQVKSQVGLTFASALRAFLRQDPDIIMVGEVRDQETAEICLRAALTGHFVLSTLHTNDALSAINRLEDMGIEPFLLSATLRIVQAQRLLRRLCRMCKEPYSCDQELVSRYGGHKAIPNLNLGQKLYRAKGCPICRNTGYKGRVGIFEVIRITSTLSDLIQSRAPLPEMRRAVQEHGMKLLFDSAMDKVRDGTTSLEEALSVGLAGDE